MLKTAAVIAVVAGVTTVHSAIDADKVESIPGYVDGDLKSSHYSGYLPVGNSSGAGLGQLHYWLIESEDKPETDPLVMWLNGGPGSSSLIGLLNENGQIKVNDATLEVDAGESPKSFYNEFSWSQKANILYLEQPKGVGFSYCESGSSGCKNSDDNVGPDVHDFLVGFFEGFPEYSDRDFYITGESYGGTYIPLIMKTISDNGVINNLKGAAIGNGCTQGSCFTNYDEEWVDYQMYKGHSMISMSLAKEIDDNCGDWSMGAKGSACKASVNKMRTQTGRFNVYNLFDTCGSDTAVDMQALRAQQKKGGAGIHFGFEESLKAHPTLTSIIEGEGEGKEKKAGRALSETHADIAWNGVNYPCGNDAGLSAFLKDKAVMEALHVNKDKSGQSYHSTAGNLQPIYSELAQKYNMVIFSGDADMCVPYTYTASWTADLGLTVKTDWHSWASNSLQDAGSTTGGYAIEYEAGGDTGRSFYFVTVKGSGHMVPQYKPGFGLTFFENFLKFDF